jgi:hypothetical protein
MLDYYNIDPPCNEWKDYQKPMLIQQVILDFARDVMKKGDNTNYPELFQMLEEFIEDRIENYIPEEFHD